MTGKNLNNPHEEDLRESRVGEMQARREKMADGKRYIIYYTFGEETEPQDKLTNEQGGISEDV
jgi:hypothetical protein